MIPDFKPHEIAAAMRVLDHELETNFAAFIRKTFATVSPGDPFKPNWHIEAIAYALERVARGELKRLIILIPPRHLKSICASCGVASRARSYTAHHLRQLCGRCRR
jgi:hypothetical protein